MTDVTRRPVADDDRAFLLTVYASSREREMAQVPWSEAQKATFLEGQFDAQVRSYGQQFPDVEHAVLECDGHAIGRAQVAREPDGILLLDLTLLPAWRSKGLGTAVLRELMAEAAAAAIPLRVHVEQGNPARRLYQRLDFRVVEHQGLHDLLQWDSPPT